MAFCGFIRGVVDSLKAQKSPHQGESCGQVDFYTVNEVVDFLCMNSLKTKEQRLNKSYRMPTVSLLYTFFDLSNSYLLLISTSFISIPSSSVFSEHKILPQHEQIFWYIKCSQSACFLVLRSIQFSLNMSGFIVFF